MIFRSRSLVVLPVLALTGILLAQTPSDPLVKQDFKDSQGGWMTFGPNATLTVSHDSPAVSPGEGALKFGYSVKKGDMSGLVFPVQLGTLTRAKSLKFRIRADAETVIAVMLQEQDGGRYVATCTAPKDAWQPIELSTDDFALSTDPGDPKDPDGKLDMDQVNGIVVTDVAQMFAQSDDENLKSLLGVQNGSHSLYLDEFSVSPDPLPAAQTIKGSDIVLDSFVHPQIGWFGLGGGELTRASGGPIGGAGLKLAYHQATGKVAVIAHAIAAGSLTGAHTMSIDFASQQPARLMVQIEQTDGGKYNAPVDLEGGPMSKHFILAFDSFKPSDDSKVAIGKPDMSKVKTFLILDLSGVFGQADRDNVLWVGQTVVHR